MINKLIIATSFLALAIILSTQTAGAAEISIVPTPLFQMKTLEINKIQSTGESKFDLQVTDVQNKDQIGYWKIRVYCEEGIEVHLGATTTDSCGKATNFYNLDTFSLFLENHTSMTKKFSYKVKAYDKMGKWMHTEGYGFRWR